MPQNRDRKTAIREHAAAAGLSYTAAMRDLDGAAPTAAPAWPALPVGAKVRLTESRSAYTVRAVSASGRFAVLTKPNNLHRSVWYTVVDFALGICGTDDRYGLGYETDEQCAAALTAFERRAAGDATGIQADGTFVQVAEVSHRSWGWLRFADKQPEAQVQALLPALRRTAAAAPSRGYNDHAPCTDEELVAWVAGEAVPVG